MLKISLPVYLKIHHESTDDSRIYRCILLRLPQPIAAINAFLKILRSFAEDERLGCDVAATRSLSCTDWFVGVPDVVSVTHSILSFHSFGRYILTAA